MAVTWALVRVWYLTGFWGPATSDAHLMGDGIATSAHFTRTQDLHEHTISRDAQTFFRYDEKYEQGRDQYVSSPSLRFPFLVGPLFMFV